MGAAFGVVAVVGVAVLLIWEVARALHLHSGTYGLNDLSISWLFGAFPLGRAYVLSTWLTNVGMMFFSTLLSVAIHEFGHAIAAASEGIPIEYFAIFWAIIFPGALVALNDDLLLGLPRLAVLRIYCAGIWHNLMFCAVCWTAVLLLPWMLNPLYFHGEAPLVLEVPQTSPLTGYLSYGDVISAVDGSRIHFPREWTEKMVQIHSQMLHKAGNGRKGYCIPNSWCDSTNNTHVVHDRISCPGELTAFVSAPCLNSSFSSGFGDNKSANRRQISQCLTAKDVVKLKKCGDGWEMIGTSRSKCACLEDEFCMAPVQSRGMPWVEVSYSIPNSPECSQQRKNTSIGSEISDDRSPACGGTFVFIGDVLSLAQNIRLSSYRPRLAHLSADIPTLLENFLSCTFHVSASLVVLNSLPVFFLDGESILETGFRYITWLSRRRRHKVLKLCLIGGSIISVIVIGRIILDVLASHDSFSLKS